MRPFSIHNSQKTRILNNAIVLKVHRSFRKENKQKILDWIKEKYKKIVEITSITTRNYPLYKLCTIRIKGDTKWLE